MILQEIDKKLGRLAMRIDALNNLRGLVKDNPELLIIVDHLVKQSRLSVGTLHLKKLQLEQEVSDDVK